MQIDFYSSESWGAGPARSKVEKRELVALDHLDHIKSKSDVMLLDLGCGDGFFLSFVQKNRPSWKLVGSDGSQAMLDKAKKFFPNIEFKISDLINPLPFPDASFDVVYSGEVIEHLLETDHFLKEINRVLKPGGQLILTTPNLMAWYNRLLILFGCSPLYVEYSTKDASVGYGFLKRFMASSAPVGHLRIFHPSAMLDILKITGFKETKIKAAPFERFPGPALIIDRIFARLWPRGGSVMVVSAKK